MRAEDGAGAERANDFVVAHVNNPDIGAGAGTVARDGHNHIRVNASHSGVDDLEFYVRMAHLQHRLQHAGQPEARLRIAEGG